MAGKTKEIDVFVVREHIDGLDIYREGVFLTEIVGKAFGDYADDNDLLEAIESALD